MLWITTIQLLAVAVTDVSFLHGFYSQGGLFGLAVDPTNDLIYTLHSTAIVSLDIRKIEATRQNLGIQGGGIRPQPGLTATTVTSDGFLFTVGDNITKYQQTDDLEVLFDIPTGTNTCNRLVSYGDYIYGACTDKIIIWNQLTGVSSFYTPPSAGVHSTVFDITISEGVLYYMIGTYIREIKLSNADGSLSTVYSEIDVCNSIPPQPRIVSVGSTVYCSCLMMSSPSEMMIKNIVIPDGSSVQGIYAEGNQLWIIDDRAFLHLFDISVNKNPIHVRQIQLPPGDYTVIGMAFGGRLYICSDVGVFAYGTYPITNLWKDPNMNNRECFAEDRTTQFLDSIPLLATDGSFIQFGTTNKTLVDPEIGTLHNSEVYSLLYSNTSGICSVAIKTPSTTLFTDVSFNCSIHTVNSSTQMGLFIYSERAFIDVGIYEPEEAFSKQWEGEWTGKLYSVDLSTGISLSSNDFNMSSAGNFISRAAASIATMHFISRTDNVFGDTLITITHGRGAVIIFRQQTDTITQVALMSVPAGNGVSGIDETLYVINSDSLFMYNLSDPQNIKKKYLPMYGITVTATQRVVLCSNSDKRYEDGGYAFITEEVGPHKMGSVMRFVRTGTNSIHYASGSLVTSDYYLYHLSQKCDVVSPTNIDVVFRYMGVFGIDHLRLFGEIESRYTSTQVNIFRRDSMGSLSLSLNFSAAYPSMGPPTRFASRDPMTNGVFILIGDMCTGSSLGPGPHGDVRIAVRACSLAVRLEVHSNNTNLVSVFPTDKGGIIGVSLTDDNYMILHRVGSSVLGGDADRVIVEKSILPFPEIISGWCPTTIRMDFRGIGSGVRKYATCSGHSYCMPHVIDDVTVCVDNINPIHEGNFITTRGLSTGKVTVSRERASPVVGFGSTFVEPLKLYPAYIKSDSTQLGIVHLVTGEYTPIRYTFADALTIVRDGEEYIFGCGYDSLIGYHYRPGSLSKIFPEGLYQSCWKIMSVGNTLIVFNDIGKIEMYDITDIMVPVPASTGPYEAYTVNSYPSPALAMLPEKPGYWGGYISIGKDATSVEGVAYSQPVLTYYHNGENKSDTSPSLTVGEAKQLRFGSACFSMNSLFLSRCKVTVVRVEEVTRFLPQKSRDLPFWVQEMSPNVFQFSAPKEYTGTNLILRVYVSLQIELSSYTNDDVHILRIPVERSLFIVRHNDTTPPYASITSPAPTIRIFITYVSYPGSGSSVEFVPETFPGLFCSYPTNSIECMGSSVGVNSMLRRVRYSPNGNTSQSNFLVALRDDINFDLEEEVPPTYFKENRAPELYGNKTLKTAVRDKFVLNYPLPTLFRDPDGDVVIVKANTTNADWLSFDTEKQKLFGTASLSDSSRSKEYAVEIIGSDGYKQRSIILYITIHPNIAPLPRNLIDSLNYTCISKHSCRYPLNIDFIDPESDPISYKMEGQEDWMHYSEELQLLRVQPGDVNGTFSITLLVSDSFNTTEVSIDINILSNSNPIQLTTIDAISLRSGSSLFVNISSHLSDPDGDDIIVTDDSESPISWMKLNNGVIQGSPEPEDEGSYTPQFLISDGHEGTLRVSIRISVSMSFMDQLLKWIEDYGTVTGMLGLLIALFSLRHPIYNFFFRRKYLWVKPPEDFFCQPTYFPQKLPRKLLGLLVDSSTVKESSRFPGAVVGDYIDIPSIDIASVRVYQLSGKAVPGFFRGMFQFLSRDEVLISDDFFIKTHGAGVKVDVADFPTDGPSFSILFTGKSGYHVQEILIQPHAELKYFSNAPKFNQLLEPEDLNDGDWLLDSQVEDQQKQLEPLKTTDFPTPADVDFSNGSDGLDPLVTRNSVNFNILKPISDFPQELTQSLTADSSFVQL